MTAGLRVEFVEEATPWTVVTLENGTRIRCKCVITSVKTTDRQLPDGQPAYDIQIQPVFDQAAPVEKPIEPKKGAII